MAKRMPHVIGIQAFIDSVIGISLAYSRREELDGAIGELRRKANSHSVVTTKTPFLPCRIGLTETDWGIIRAITRDPRRPYGNVAEELGLSRRTVKRRAQRRLNGHAFFILPELDLKKMDGVLANLSVVYPPGLKKEIDRQIFERYGGSLIIGHSTQPNYGWFAFVVPNLGVAKKIQAWVGTLEGVSTAQVAVSEEIIYPSSESFEGELRRAPLVMVTGKTTPTK